MVGLLAASASSSACNPCAASWWCSAVHGVVPSPPPPPRSAPVAGCAADSRSATVLIAGSVAINRRVLLPFRGTCPTLLLNPESSHAPLPKAHDTGGFERRHHRWAWASSGCPQAGPRGV